MVVPLGPGKFYGSSLPRPRYYTDVKLNDERVDPPTPVLDPLLSWANEAHWSMGGLSFNRLRLQGRIEGNVHKLRVEREKVAKKKLKAEKLDSAPKRSDPDAGADAHRQLKKARSVTPPPAPVATKRRRLMVLFEDEDDVGMDKEEIGVVKRRLVKKLGDDFDRVAAESKRNQLKGLKDRSSEINEVNESVMKIVEEINNENTKVKEINIEKKGKTVGKVESVSVSGTRTSPRLANKRA
ncbi:uncharacterized protein E5676_scaffold13G003380 [Cucumis melo var. makuwa]|uniref:Uncharacterized protein LOC103495510 n=2 Tax=Cucumis melo TaxID=3656 RepID=A0A1S3C0M4_CUCME|nr:uncharacterized protein LOC103495510 [Cucumis melo]KAA0031571.1 uncharacterized protein E6C27_scaffold139G003370 [Cucumis melo var. makuwa]TYK07022.1 uncharacterized protein E5676_scaffold13G003380 [Cucumis melo var. makuwa]